MAKLGPDLTRRSWPRYLLRLGIIFIAGPYVAVVLLVTLFQRSFYYGPTRVAELPPERFRVAHATVSSVWLSATDGLRLNGWEIVSDVLAASSADIPVDSRTHAKSVVVYFCGNGWDRSGRTGEFTLFASLGADVFCFDYRGYGDNAGRTTESALAADAQSVWKYVTEARAIDPGRVVLFGESLGGAVAVRLAAEACAAGTPPGGLILRSPFSSLADAGAWHMPWLPVRLMLFDRYPSIDRIGQVTCPILVVHGERDSIIPFELGQKLFAGAPGTASDGTPKRMVELPTADHNDVLETEYETLRSAIATFLAQRHSTKSSP